MTLYGARALVNGERLERMTPGGVEVRAAASGQPTIYGHGATFGVMTRIADWFGSYMERVDHGAFAKTLADGADVRALFNHDPNYVLGRTKSGTLTLSVDDTGLAYEATPPDTQWARDLRTTMARGDVDGSSFGFRVVRDKWSTVLDPEGDGKKDMMDLRTLLEVQLYDVSPVTYPAYAESDSGVRSALQRGGFDVDGLLRAVVRSQRGLDLRANDQATIRAAIDHLQGYLAPNTTVTISAPAQPSHAPTPPPATEPAQPSHSASSVMASLALLERSIAADDVSKLARF